MSNVGNVLSGPLTSVLCRGPERWIGVFPFASIRRSPTLRPQLQSRFLQTVRHFGFTHEFNQELVDLPGFVDVCSYHIVQLIRIGFQIEKFRSTFFRAVEQTPFSRGDSGDWGVGEGTEQVVHRLDRIAGVGEGYAADYVLPP